MSSVLVGMFGSASHATMARERLMAAGFAAHAVSSVDGSTETASALPPSDAPQPQGAIARFFCSIFGDGSDDTDEAGRTGAYHEAFKRGAHFVAVTTADDADTDRAEHILNECGVVDIDEKAESWRNDGWAGPALHDGAVTRGGLRVFTRPGDAAHTGSVGSANRDPLTGEPGAQPIGTGVGAAAGGLAAGALAGTVVGPVGTVIGAAVGAIAGGLAGKDVAQMLDTTLDESQRKP